MRLFSNTKPYLQVLILLLLWLLMTLLASSFMVVCASAGVDIQEPDNQLWLQLVSQLVAFVGTAILFAFLFCSDGLRSFSFDGGRRQWGRAVAAVAIVLLLIPAVDWLSVWNESWHLPEQFAQVESRLRFVSEQSQLLVELLLLKGDVGHLAANLLVLALCPALCEELFFRGTLQPALNRWFRNPHVAIVLTAIIFSIAHGDLFGFLPRLVLGVVLGYLYHLSGSLVVNICAHFINNAIIVVLYYLYVQGIVVLNPSDPLCSPWLLTVLSLLAAAALFFLYFVKPQVLSARQ